MDLHIKRYEELTLDEFYAILHLRIAVFVVEQQCPYQDLDENDRKAFHLWLGDDQGIASYLRMFLNEEGTMMLGRVVSARRGQGLGGKLLQEAIAFARQLGHRHVELEAQSYARGFYEKAGFRQVSDEFLEDGIPHIRMALDIK